MDVGIPGDPQKASKPRIWVNVWVIGSNHERTDSILRCGVERWPQLTNVLESPQLVAFRSFLTTKTESPQRKRASRAERFQAQYDIPWTLLEVERLCSAPAGSYFGVPTEEAAFSWPWVWTGERGSFRHEPGKSCCPHSNQPTSLFNSRGQGGAPPKVMIPPPN